MLSWRCERDDDKGRGRKAACDVLIGVLDISVPKFCLIFASELLLKRGYIPSCNPGF